MPGLATPRISEDSAQQAIRAATLGYPPLFMARYFKGSKGEDIALKDDYFVERKLYPNVDFYTGVIYKAMGFPERMFTVLFAIGRLPGWIAHWREMMLDPQTKIGRPQQLYVGPTERHI